MAETPPPDLVPINKPASGGPPADLVPIQPAAAKVPNSPMAVAPGQVQADQDARKLLNAGTAHETTDSLMGGAALGWMNELTADEYAAITGAENAYRKATGKPVPYGMSEARSAMLHEQRRDQEAFHERHPMLDEALKFGGAMATPGMKKGTELVSEGKNMLTRAARSAGFGAGIGAVAGASDERDRVKGAEEGAVGGALFGGGLHLLGSFANAGGQIFAKHIKEPLVDAWKTVQSAFGADLKGATQEQIAKAQRAALEYVHKIALAAKKTPEDLANDPDRAMGKPKLAAESLGRQGVTQLGSLGRRSGETPDALESTLRQRNQWAPSRIYSDLSELTQVDPNAIEGDFAQQIKAMRAKAAPLYDVAYQDKADTPTLRKLLERPSMKKALSKAVKIAEEEGVDPMTVGLVPKGGPNIGAHAEDDALQLVQVENPTMRTWDYIKRALDDVLEDTRDPVSKRLKTDHETGAINETLKSLRSELFKESPAYELALQQGGEAPRQREAYDAAKELMSPNVTEQKFKNRVFGENGNGANAGGMTPAQREAFKGGLISDINNQVRNGRLKLKDMQNPAYVEKLRSVLGFDAANQFLNKMDAEMRIGATGARMKPGNQSATMEFAAADSEREDHIKDVAQAAFKAGKGKFLESIMDLAKKGAATARTRELDEVSRNEVGRLLMLTPEELSKALDAHIKSRKSDAAKDFVRELARDETKLEAARRIAGVALPIMPGAAANVYGQSR